MTHGSLFSGIGGFDLAARWAGIETLWQVEIDPYCRRILERHFPNAKRYGDIRTVRGAVANSIGGRCKSGGECGSVGEIQDGSAHSELQIEESGEILSPVSIISGGFPCQPFSVAGKRKGREDNRFLWPEMLRVIREVQPSWVIAENVGGLLTQENGLVFEHCLSDLEAAGYEVQPFVIPACAVNAPHRRDRVWIVAHERREHLEQGQHGEGQAAGGTSKSGQNVADGENAKPDRWRNRARRWGESSCNDDGCGKDGINWWKTEPDVGRVAHGIPSRVDRLKGLGNAIVPAVAYQIFNAIVEAERANGRHP